MEHVGKMPQPRNKDKRAVVLNTYAVMCADGFTGVSAKYVELALRKAEVWMRNAYGGVDWAHYLAECGDVTAYYAECVHAPNAPDTFNRQTATNKKGLGT